MDAIYCYPTDPVLIETATYTDFASFLKIGGTKEGFDRQYKICLTNTNKYKRTETLPSLFEFKVEVFHDI